LNDPSVNICAGVRWLFEKRRLTSSRLKKSASWLDGVWDYKGTTGKPKEETYTPTEAVIFESSGIKDDWVIPGFIPPLSNMTFGSFDYSILFPEAHFEHSQSSQQNSPATEVSNSSKVR
jgi:hypothetical protein